MANQSKDPVCGMSVDSNQTQYKADYQGKHFAFCCQECLSKFKQDPSQYQSGQ
jgi:YHS domain-containing protein